MSEQPNTEPQAAAPRKKHRVRNVILGTVGAIVLISVIANMAGGEEDPTTQAPAAEEPAAAAEGEPAAAEEEAPKEEAPKEEAAPGIGDKVSDGDLEFVVTDVKTDVATIGDNEFTQVEANGEFVLVELTVSNTGDKSVMFSESESHLVDADGKQYSPSDDALFALEDTPFLEDINPGNSVDGTLAFDVPAEMEPTAITLVAGLFSDGVTVELR